MCHEDTEAPLAQHHRARQHEELGSAIKALSLMLTFCCFTWTDNKTLLKEGFWAGGQMEACGFQFLSGREVYKALCLSSQLFCSDFPILEIMLC